MGHVPPEAYSKQHATSPQLQSQFLYDTSQYLPLYVSHGLPHKILSFLISRKINIYILGQRARVEQSV
jgi:hypothetical protein